MRKTNFSRGLAKAVAILCILAMLPIVYVSAEGLSFTATAGDITLAESELGATVEPIDKNAQIVVNGTASAQGKWMSIIVAEKTSQGMGDIQYIDQVTSGVNGAFSFSFPLPTDIKDGTYELRVTETGAGMQGAPEIYKRYFVIGTVEPFITVPATIPAVDAGKNVEFDVKSNLTPLVVQLIEQENPDGEDTIRTGTISENQAGTYTATVGTVGLKAGTYPVKVLHEQSGKVAATSVEIVERKYTVMVQTKGTGKAGVVDSTGSSVSSAEFLPGELVSVVASGGTFSSWSSLPQVTFGNANSASTIFIMPENDVIVTATFTTAVTPTRPPGGGSGGSGSGGGGYTKPTATPVPTATPEPTATPTPDVDPTPTPSSEPSGNYPADIAGVWSEPYIQDVMDKGIMKGNTDGTFQPEGKLTRGEFATSMVRMLGLEPASGKVFADTEGHWAQDYVSVLVENGVIQGYDDSTFGVEDPITREQIALILCRAYGLKGNSVEVVEFPDDGQISDWAREAVYTVQAFGYMTGDDAGFRPQDTATRGEIASVLSRMLKQ